MSLLAQVDPSVVGWFLTGLALFTAGWGGFNWATGEATEGDEHGRVLHVIHRSTEPRRFKLNILLTMFGSLVLLAAGVFLLVAGQ